jgi:hypothetical protein
VCCRGRDRAVCLYFEASGVIPNLSSISRGLLPQAQLSVCLFVCLGKDLLPIGQSFFFSSSDFAANRQAKSLFALAGFTACIGFSCSLVCFNLEGKAAQDAHAGSVPGSQFIELASRKGSDRNVGWLDTKVYHRPYRWGMAERVVGLHAAFIDLARAYAGNKHRYPVSLSSRAAIMSGHYHIGGA